MDYSKLSDATLKSLSKGEKLDVTRLSDDELKELYSTTPREEVGSVEAFLRGAAQGASFGFADEITGALESAFTKKSYKQARDESRANYKKAEKDSPVAYNVGDIGASVATAFVPGLNVAKGATLAARAGKAAALGGITGLGRSEGDLKDQSKDILVGAALGGVAQGVGEKVIAPAVKKTGELASKYLGKKLLMKGFLGVPEKATDRYLERPEAVRSASDLDGIGDKLAKTFNNWNTNTRSHLNAYVKTILPEALDESAIPRADVVKTIREIQDGLLTHGQLVSDDAAQAFSALDRKLEAIAKLNPDDDRFSQRTLKEIILDVGDDVSSWAKNPAESPGKLNALRSLRGKLSKILKDRNEDYKAAMDVMGPLEESLDRTRLQFGLKDRFTPAEGRVTVPTDRTASQLRKIELAHVDDTKNQLGKGINDAEKALNAFKEGRRNAIGLIGDQADAKKLDAEERLAAALENLDLFSSNALLSQETKQPFVDRLNRQIKGLRKEITQLSKIASDVREVQKKLPDFANDVADAATANAFEKKSPYGGSRNVVMSALLGGVGGWGLGGPVGGGIGAFAGPVIDAYGPKIGKALLDLRIDIGKLAGSKFMAPILAAAKRGNKSLAATHAILKTYPEYRDLLEDK